jgi:hypothetical protein
MRWSPFLLAGFVVATGVQAETRGEQSRAGLNVQHSGNSAVAGNGDALLVSAASLYHNGRTAEAVAAYDRAAATLDEAGRTDQAFDAAMTAAAIVRQAGEVAQAAVRYRNLAAGHVNHRRAPEAHRLAILCVADRMRIGPPSAEQPPQLAAAYQALLREHLAQWPEAATAGDVRWWLGGLLAARHEWPAARDVLQSIQPPHEHFAAAAGLVADCYRRELRNLDRHDSQRKATLISAATRYLQPIITGPDNRWPAEWSDLQLATAVSLARLHLLDADGPSDYAERLLTAAIGGAAASPDGQRCQQAARPLLVVALARSGNIAEARAAVGKLGAVPPASLIEALDQLDEQLAVTAADQRPALGRLMLDTAGLVDARRGQLGQLDAEAAARLDRHRAAALAAVGDRDAALAQYATLAAQRSNDGQIHEDYATLLAEGNSADVLRAALREWQEVEEHSRRGGPRWIRARQARIQLLDRLGERQEAARLLQLTRLLYPDWDRLAP